MGAGTQRCPVTVLSEPHSGYAYATAQFIYKLHKLSWKVPRRLFSPADASLQCAAGTTSVLSYLGAYLHDLISNLESCNFCWASLCHPCYIDALEKIKCSFTKYGRIQYSRAIWLTEQKNLVVYYEILVKNRLVQFWKIEKAEKSLEYPQPASDNGATE